MFELFLIWACAVIATEAVVNLIVASEIMFNVRDWVAQHSIFFGKLINCEYCASVWVAAPFAYYLPVGHYLDTLCAGNLLLWCIVLVAKVAVVHRVSNVVHEWIDRWLTKHRPSLELVQYVVNDRKNENGQ